MSNYVIKLSTILKVTIAVLDIQGKGDMLGGFENVRARVKMNARKFERDGQMFMKFEKFNLKIQIGKNKLELKNLFNGDPNLGAIGNQVSNILSNNDRELIFNIPSTVHQPEQ